MSATTANVSARLEDFAEVLQWCDANSAYIRCPGEAFHTTPTGHRDCKVFLNGAPSGHCQHQSCKAEVEALSSELRRAFPSNRPGWRADAGRRIDHATVRAARKAMLAREGQATRARVLAEFPWTRRQIESESPSRLDGDLDAVARQFVALAGKSADLVWIGHNERSNEWNAIRTRAEWAASNDLLQRPAWCANPLAKRNAGRRADNVAHVRFVTLEADHLHENDDRNADLSGSLLLWARERLGLKLFAVIESGRRSLHGVIAADDKLRQSLASPDFVTRLSAIGFDPALARPAQAWRFPCHTRADTGRVQKLIYFDPAAGAIRSEANTTERSTNE